MQRKLLGSLVLCAAATVFSGCPASGSSDSGTVVKRKPSSTAGSSGAGGGGDSGSSTGYADAGNGCPALGTLLPLDAGCPAGEFEILGNAESFCQTNPAPVPGLQIYGQGTATAVESDGCGYWHICAPPGELLNITSQGSIYLPTTYAEIDVSQSIQLPGNPGFLVLCDSVLSSVAEVLPPNALDKGDGVVLVSIAPSDGDGGFYSPDLPESPGPLQCVDRSGWTLVLEDEKGDQVRLYNLDGGEEDAGAYYVSGLLLDLNATATDSRGIALFFNVPPNIGKVRVVGTRDGGSLPDGGVLCPNVGALPPFTLTNLVSVQSGGMSYVPYIIAPSP